MPEIISNIANIGVAGVAVCLFYDLLRKHLRHNTEVLEKLVKTIAELSIFIREKR